MLKILGRYGDRLLVGATALVMLCVLGSSLFAEDSKYSNLDIILDQNLQKLNALESKVTGVEYRVESVEKRLSKVEQSLQETAQESIVETPVLSTLNPQLSTNYYSRNELDQWVRQRYSRSTPLTHGLMARGQSHLVYQHLVDGNHGFKSDQVNGLEKWVALALHDAEHGGLISPQKSSSNTLASYSPPSIRQGQSGLPTEQNGNWLYWNVDGVRWSNLGSGVAENRVYSGNGQSWIYHNGRMHQRDSRSTVQPTIVNYAPQYTSGNCANGQCNRSYAGLFSRR
jgi:hypothetical protein